MFDTLYSYAIPNNRILHNTSGPSLERVPGTREILTFYIKEMFFCEPYIMQWHPWIEIAKEGPAK